MDEDYSRFYMSQLPDPPGAHSAAPADAPPAAPVETAAAAPAPVTAVRVGAEHRHPPSLRRLIVGIVLGAALSLLGGWILGEYPFTGIMPYITGVLFALVIAEVILSVSRRTDWVTAVVAAVCTVGGLGLAVWISTGRGIDPVPIGGVMTIVVGAATALLRGGIRKAQRRVPSSQPSS